MQKNHLNYYTSHAEKTFPDQKQLITYSFNNVERTIIGIMEEKEGLIYLYEFRGKYVGFEFLISFSKKSISYELIEVKEMIT
jgi:hypothetical protein